MIQSIFVLASLLCADVPGVAELIPADALAVVATDDLAELTRRARTLPVVAARSRDEWRATLDSIAPLERWITGLLPSSLGHSGIDVSTVGRAYAALLPLDQDSWCVEIGLEGRDGKPPTMASDLSFDRDANMLGDVLILGSCSSSVERLADAPRFRDELDTWTRPAGGLWAWVDRDALVEATRANPNALGAFLPLLAQRYGSTYAWALDVAESDDAPPTFASTTWIAREPGAIGEPPAFDRSNLRIVPMGTQWMQTVHWDPVGGNAAIARALRESDMILGLRGAETATSTDRRDELVMVVTDGRSGNTTIAEGGFTDGFSMSGESEFRGLLRELEEPLADLMNRSLALSTTRPQLDALLKHVRPPLILAWNWWQDESQPEWQLCVAIEPEVTLHRAASVLCDRDKTEQWTWDDVSIERDPASGVVFTIVDGWLVVTSSARGATAAIDRIRGSKPGIEDAPRFRATFDRLVADGDEVQDVEYCDAPTILSQGEDTLLDAVRPWFRDGTFPALVGLDDVAPPSVAVVRATPNGVRIDRVGFPGGELTSFSGIAAIGSGLAEFGRRRDVEERTAFVTTLVSHDFDALAAMLLEFRTQNGRWPTIAELQASKPSSIDPLFDPWDIAYEIEPIDERRCRIRWLGVDSWPGGLVDADFERTVIAEP